MTAAPDVDGAADTLGQQILAQLQAKGPLSTKALGDAVKRSVYFVKAALKLLAKSGRIHRVGATASSKWHLGAAGKKPAKEAP